MFATVKMSAVFIILIMAVKTTALQALGTSNLDEKPEDQKAFPRHIRQPFQRLTLRIRCWLLQ